MIPFASSLLKNSSFFLVFLLLFYSCNNNDVLKLADHGKSDYIIVIPENADTTVLKAGRLLQQYLWKTTETNIGIVQKDAQFTDGKNIMIGFPEKGLGTHQILIKNEGSNLIISGGDSQSTLNAVSVFLEKYLSCRWYAPDVEKIPKMTTLLIPSPIYYT
ncbi:MAG: hypothetical protein J7L04_02700, partial [Bacteroidales bacterium]|nr:hypothetical protein [Bacteroidales bacterium]